MRLEEIKRQARIYSVLALVVMLLMIGQEVGSLITTAVSGAELCFSPRRLLFSLPMLLFMVLILSHALLLLHSVAKEESPFNRKNIRHLQRIGILFISYEPLVWLTSLLHRSLFPISLGTATYVSYTVNCGGVFLVSGLVVLAVSNIFRYGAELQKLSDETL